MYPSSQKKETNPQGHVGQIQNALGHCTLIRSRLDPASRLYLGVVFWGKARLIDFALQFPPQPLPAAR